jgi:hypothetical protein
VRVVLAIQQVQMAQMVLTLYLAQSLQLAVAVVLVIHPKRETMVALGAVDKALPLAQAHLVRATMAALVALEMLAVVVVALLLSVVRVLSIQAVMGATALRQA